MRKELATFKALIKGEAKISITKTPGDTTMDVAHQ
jgi:hypothetical protein